MTAVTSKVDICNLALDRLAAAALINNIDVPNDIDSSIMARWYDQTRRAEIKKYVWNFAKTRKVLARSAIVPAFEYTDQYPLPNDFLRLLSIGQYEYDQMTEYDITGDETDGMSIVCNNGGSNSLYIRYIRDVTNVALYDPLFINVLSIQLALNVSFKYNLKVSVIKKLELEMTNELAKAVSVDGQQRRPRRIQNSKFVNARRNLGVLSNTASNWTIIN